MQNAILCNYSRECFLNGQKAQPNARHGISMEMCGEYEEEMKTMKKAQFPWTKLNSCVCMCVFPLSFWLNHLQSDLRGATNYNVHPTRCDLLFFC